ncbi:CAP domain-containing protein [Streptomyces sp. WAC06614]|uniref:CAP domain-containing protein n=1 Tax=Streptomyces sp. WAC06614 TaxID=2487416 RepID=UPI000F798E14|nr:CAP domain-containing protein [Streptomyces sp. WAC06614]RSS74062.1 CAP domain-containing protein [Streptomyces sp. WAC06614]
MGRHRLPAPRRGRGSVVRNTLLGVCVAAALGTTAAVTTGVVPVGDSFPYLGEKDTKPRAKAAPKASASAHLQQQGGLANLSGRASTGPGAADSASPSASGSPSPSASSSPSAPASPSATPSPTPSTKAPEKAAPAPAKPEAKPAPKPAAKPPAVVATGHSAEETAVLDLVNVERAKAGCPAVRANPPLAGLAGAFSEEMATLGFFSHTDPAGNSPWDRAAKAGISGLGGENIARGQGDAQAVMTAWMNSPGHRANILNCEFRTLGVGLHVAPGGPWWTQDFGFGTAS